MRIIRIVAALSALVAGYAHIRLYFDGYKDIPVANIGTQFLLNALGAVAIAVMLVVPLYVKEAPVWQTLSGPLAGLGWGTTSLVAFFAARRGSGWFGFRDLPGFNPSPEAQLAVGPEIVVVLACIALLIVELSKRTRRSAEIEVR